MIGVAVAAKTEWKTLLEVYGIDDSNLEKYPYGEFYRTVFNNKDIVFFRTGIRKINASGAVQYMIDRFDLEKLVVVGTCAAVNDNFDYLDVLIPERVVDYDSVLREISPDIPEDVYVEIDVPKITSDHHLCTLGTSDKALVLWKDLTYLASIAVDASDMEAYAMVKVAKKNNIEFCILKGVSDRPMKNSDGFDEQVDVYEENTPIVMKKMIEDYLPEVL